MTSQRAPATTDSGQIISASQALAQVGGRDIVTFDDARNAPIQLSIGSVKRLFCPKATDEEAWTFIQLCRAQRLNPFLREAYLIKYQDGEPASIVVGNQVFIRRAEEHPDFAGFQAGVIAQTQHGQLVYHEGAFYLPGETIVGGWFKGWKHSSPDPHVVRVLFQEFAATKRDGTYTKFWLQMPAVMVRKVSIGHGLREMYPKDFQGLYSEEEVGVTLTEGDRKPIEAANPQWDHVGESIAPSGVAPPSNEPQMAQPAPRPAAAAASPASPEPRSQAQGEQGSGINQKQLARMYAIANSQDYKRDAVNDAIHILTDNVNHLPRDRYDQLCKWMEEGKPLADLVALWMEANQPPQEQGSGESGTGEQADDSEAGQRPLME